jgi:hypothetical protein
MSLLGCGVWLGFESSGWRRLALFLSVGWLPTCQCCVARRLPETVERDLIGAWLSPRLRSVRSPVAPSCGWRRVDELGRAIAERGGPVEDEVVAWARALGIAVTQGRPALAREDRSRNSRATYPWGFLVGLQGR